MTEPTPQPKHVTELAQDLRAELERRASDALTRARPGSLPPFCVGSVTTPRDLPGGVAGRVSMFILQDDLAPLPPPSATRHYFAQYLSDGRFLRLRACAVMPGVPDPAGVALSCVSTLVPGGRFDPIPDPFAGEGWRPTDAMALDWFGLSGCSVDVEMFDYPEGPRPTFYVWRHAAPGRRLPGPSRHPIGYGPTPRAALQAAILHEIPHT